jgi:Tol biopolymer transport system component
VKLRFVLATCLVAAGCSDSTGLSEQPDDRPIVYFRQDNPGTGAWMLAQVSALGGAPTPLSPPVTETLFPALSPDGSRLAFVSEGDARGIYVGAADGSGARQVHAGVTDHIAWSPDGSRLAFEIDGEIIVVGADGAGAQTITANVAVLAGHPSWSRRGRIAFSTRTPAGIGSDIYTMAPNGSDVRVFVAGEGQDARDPAWSRDGSRLAFALGHHSASSIFTVNANGGDRRRVTTASEAGLGETDLGPAWAASGQWIAFQREHSVCEGQLCTGRYDVFVVRTDGANLRNVTAGSLWGGVRPTW